MLNIRCYMSTSVDSILYKIDTCKLYKTSKNTKKYNNIIDTLNNMMYIGLNKHQMFNNRRKTKCTGSLLNDDVKNRKFNN